MYYDVCNNKKIPKKYNWISSPIHNNGYDGTQGEGS